MPEDLGEGGTLTGAHPGSTGAHIPLGWRVALVSRTAVCPTFHSQRSTTQGRELILLFTNKLVIQRPSELRGRGEKIAFDLLLDVVSTARLTTAP